MNNNDIQNTRNISNYYNQQQPQTHYTNQGLVSLGTQFGEYLNGEQGHDYIEGRGGNDYIEGRSGNDSLHGNSGFDQVYGGRGNDLVTGGDQNDWVFGDEGNDYVSGDAGNDYVSGGAGDDWVMGGQGSDWLVGGAGNNFINGGDGIDLAEFTGALADYTITQNAAGFQLVKDGEVNQVNNVEFFEFNGVRITSDELIDHINQPITTNKPVHLDSNTQNFLDWHAGTTYNATGPVTIEDTDGNGLDMGDQVFAANGDHLFTLNEWQANSLNNMSQYNGFQELTVPTTNNQNDRYTELVEDANGRPLPADSYVLLDKDHDGQVSDGDQVVMPNTYRGDQLITTLSEIDIAYINTGIRPAA